MAKNGWLVAGLVASMLLGGSGLGYGLYTKNHSYSETQYNENYYNGRVAGYDAGCKDSASLKVQIDEYLVQIKELMAEKQALELLKEDYKDKYEKGEITIAEYEERINEYQIQVQRLTTDLNACQELLANAGITDTFVVSFMVDNINYDSQVINEENPTLIAPLSPVKDGWIFKGWSKDGVNIVDNITAEVITENTTYTAIMEQVYFKLTNNIYLFLMISTRTLSLLFPLLSAISISSSICFCSLFYVLIDLLWTV